MIWKFILAGGLPFMAPILLCSVIAMALLLERAWYWFVLWMNRDSRLRAALLASDFDPARARRSADPVCQVLYTLHAEPNDPTHAVTLADRVVRETRSTLTVMQVIATISTSLGLLGTVAGVAMAFQIAGGNPTIAELVPALSVALNTTILGLVVYLPTFTGAQASQMLTSRLAFEIEQGLNIVQARLRRESASEIAVTV